MALGSEQQQGREQCSDGFPRQRSVSECLERFMMDAPSPKATGVLGLCKSLLLIGCEVETTEHDGPGDGGGA